MRVLLGSRVSLLIAASLVVVGTASRADELLVMPYSCSVVGGQPVLTRSQDEGHRVLGQREQRHFTACSPVNPGMCRHWTLYRFDLDCGGVRVPWVSAVAATGGTRNGRAWVEDGRLRVRVGPWWNMAPGDPCARRSGYDDRWQSGGLARYCAERKTLAPPATVEMPFGFAPMLGIDGVFVAATAQKPNTVPAPTPTISIPASPRVASIETPQPPRSEAAPRDAKAKEAPAKNRPAPEAESQPTSPPFAPPPTTSAAPGSPTKPRIINRLDPPPAARQTPSTTVVQKTPTPRAEASAESTSAPEHDEKATVHVNEKQTDPRTEDKPISVSLLGTISSASTTVVVSMAGLTLLLIAAFAWMRRRESAQLAGAASREFASVSLGALGGREKLPAMPAIARGVARQLSSVGQAPPSHRSASAPSGWGDAIPRTREEALQVLGMGVTPDASETAIKKIVDGLRLSWHPDYANDPGDLQIRELRLKQINAAWEIVTGKRAQA
jgi:hypothetical protein